MNKYRRALPAQTVEIALERGQVTTLLVGSVLAMGVVFILGVAFGSRMARAADVEPEEAPQSQLVPIVSPAAPPLTFHDALTTKRKDPPSRATKPSDSGQSTTTVSPAASTIDSNSAAQATAPTVDTRDKEPAEADQTASSKSDRTEELNRGAAEEPNRGTAEEPSRSTAEEPSRGTADLELAAIAASVMPRAKPTSVIAGSGASTTSYTVQVASSRDEKDTERLVGRLKDAGWDARVVPADLDGRGRWYRVRVGAYSTRDEAISRQAEIQREFNLAGLVVAEAGVHLE